MSLIFAETYIGNIIKKPPLSGSCLNTADIRLHSLVSDAKYDQKDHCVMCSKHNVIIKDI